MLPGRCNEKPPWSGKALRRLGDRVRDGLDGSDHVPNYDDVLLWYDDLSATVQQTIRAINWTPVLGDQPVFEVTSRAKTIDTLREKLQRDHATPLPSIQDVAGVRFEAEMVLTQQHDVALAIATAFDHDEHDIRDIRTNPHSGYRAVHVWLRLPAGRVEVQVRTHLQGRWANMYEALADSYGREVRYGWLPDDPRMAAFIEAVQDFSVTHVAGLEETMDRLYELEREFEKLRPDLERLRGRADSRSRRLRRQVVARQTRVAALRADCERDSAKYSRMFEAMESSLRGEQ